MELEMETKTKKPRKRTTKKTTEKEDTVSVAAVKEEDNTSATTLSISHEVIETETETTSPTAAAMVTTHRKKSVNEVDIEKENENNITMTILEDDVPTTKKRGRKPKGGKLINTKQDKVAESAALVNIILHLKCSLQNLYDHNNELNKMITDPLVYDPSIPPDILSYNNNTQSFSFYDDINEIAPVNAAYTEKQAAQSTNYICSSCSSSSTVTNDTEPDVNMKDITSKLKSLKINFYKNNLNDKKSACFWCTYEFDNPTCYIPMKETDQTIFGYGSFCRPECAVAYLTNENIDDSTKFERYQLLNQVYGKIYDYKKNIKPAPDPYYLLEKFYGTLSIQEYRKLLKTESIFITIDKPMTRVLPELHEDNEDILMNTFGGKTSMTETSKQTGMYKVKRESEKQKGPTKNSIMKEQFGLTA